MSYIGLPDTKTHWISSRYSRAHRNKTETSDFLLHARKKHEKKKNRPLLNTKDKNVFWKTGKSVRLGLHAMYSTYEIKYFTPVYNALKNELLDIY